MGKDTLGKEKAMVYQEEQTLLDPFKKSTRRRRARKKMKLLRESFFFVMKSALSTLLLDNSNSLSKQREEVRHFQRLLQRIVMNLLKLLKFLFLFHDPA